MIAAHHNDAFVDEDPLVALGDLYIAVDQESFWSRWRRRLPYFSAEPIEPAEEGGEMKNQEKKDTNSKSDEAQATENLNLEIDGEGWPSDSRNLLVS